MSDTDNRESTTAPEGAPLAGAPIKSDSADNTTAAPAPRISESSFEASHAELPPLSALSGNDTESASVTASATSGSAPRRGRGRGAPAGKFGAPGQNTKVAFGVVESPEEMTETLSGKHVAGYGDQQPRREERKPRETEAEPVAENTAEAPAAPATESAPKEFVPPISEGTYKADLNPENERKAREERRQQRDERPRGDRPQQQNREPRENREPRQQQPREPRENREPRGDRHEQRPRHERGDRQQGHERPRDQQQRGNRPGRITIEVPKIPVQEPTTFFGKIRRFIAEAIYGSTRAEDMTITSVPRPITPHSPEWQFNRGGHGHRDERNGNRNGGRGGFRGGNHKGGNSQNRDGRHRAQGRGGNHERREGGNRH